MFHQKIRKKIDSEELNHRKLVALHPKLVQYPSILGYRNYLDAGRCIFVFNKRFALEGKSWRIYYE